MRLGAETYRKQKLWNTRSAWRKFACPWRAGWRQFRIELRIRTGL